MIKRLFFDIEVSPNIGFFWNPGHQISVSYENIIKERAIICICYKWEGKPKVYSLQWDKNQDDKKLLEKFIKISEQADELVGHNGDNFDIKWIRGRCLFHDISMMPQYVTIDTLKESRKLFRLNSNRLDYISKYLGDTGKTETSYGLWKDITLKNCKKSIKIMVDYCKNDVVKLENVYQRMSKYIKPKTSIADYKCNCPNCNSTDIRYNGIKVRASGARVAQLQCLSCGKFHSVPERTYNSELKKRDG